ncbi:MAG: NADH-quinone oxidoreductase subunit M [Candidatus Promineifilaceae bacterium]
MDFLIDNNLLLILIVFSPVVSAFILLLLPDDEKVLIKRLAFVFSLVTLALVLFAWLNFDRTSGELQYQVTADWFPAIGASFHLGVDGISMAMILLTGILTPLAVLASFGVEDKVKMYMALFLALETGLLGLFAAMDLIIFFIFWEIGLVPMYFLIRIWGGKERRYASFKFFIYTMAGSLGLLLSIQVMGLATGTFDIPQLMERWIALDGGRLAGTNLPVEVVKQVAFWLFVVAFAIKVPIWPFHTWLPDAHTEAPTAGSMILAGVLLKLGAYGFLRLVIPFFPEQAYLAAGVLAILGTISIVQGGFAAYGQWDFKRLVAYSSINHMGFVVLGIAVLAWVSGQANVSEGMRLDAIMATNGAVLQMFNHGLSSAAMFFLVGVIYERAHTRQLKDFGGLWTVLPFFGAALIFASMASLGLPGLNGFVSEFMIVRGAWNVFTIQLAFSMLGLLMTGAYILKGIRHTLHGDLNPRWQNLKDMTLREHLVIWPLMILMLSLGIWPQWLLAIINDTVTRMF